MQQKFVCNCMMSLLSRDNRAHIPLKSFDISIKILHNIAQVFYSQKYENNSNSFVEATFSFPIPPKACFDSFEAKFQNTIIKGVIKEKEQARQEYQQAKEQGKTVAYSELKDTKDRIMSVSIGNIPPYTEVLITYSYIHKLEALLGKFWCFRLFSPTSNSLDNNELLEYLKKDISILSDCPTIGPPNPTYSSKYLWDIKVEIQSPAPIMLVQCPSHKINYEYGNEFHTCLIKLDPKHKNLLNKDFVLFFNNGRENKLDYVITPFEDGYCAMMTLLANFEDSSQQQNYENFELAKQSVKSYGMESIRGEYIFLIDRSSSMRGVRIETAKNSLILFLKSLPQDALVNIVSFGTTFSFLYEQSTYYNKDSLNHMIKNVSGMAANMGGTEILYVLKKVYQMPQAKGYPRFIFLLTDGETPKTNEILELIERNNDKARVFTIGVGSDCSTQLIIQGAICGRGRHEFVVNNTEIFEKVINLLEASLSPSYSDLSLTTDNFDAWVRNISPNPADTPFILNGQPITFFLFLRKDGFEDGRTMKFKLRMFDSIIKDYRMLEIDLDATEALENEMVSKLAIHEVMKNLESKKSGFSAREEVLWKDEKEIKQTLLDLSLKYGILCKETAFFCEIAENNQNKVLQRVSIFIPDPLSSGIKVINAPPMSTGISLPSNAIPTSSNINFKPPSSGPPIQFGTPQISTNSFYGPPPTASFKPSIPFSNPPLTVPKPGLSQQPQGGSFNMLPLPLQNHYYNRVPPTQGFLGSPPTNINIFGGPTGSIPPSSLSASEKSNVTSIESTKKIPPPQMSGPPKKAEFSQASHIPGPNPFQIGTINNQSSHPMGSNIPTSYKPQPLGLMNNSMPTLSYGSDPNVNKKGNYFDAIMKQTFEGSWDPEDRELLFKAFNLQILPTIPTEAKGFNLSTNEIWMTVLVLVWLEACCSEERNAWKLIHLKGCEWLKRQGVNYEEVKPFAEQVVKVRKSC